METSKRGMASADTATRARVASSGGIGRADALSADERVTLAQRAALAAHTPAALARRIVKRWPTLPPRERDEVRRILCEGGVTS